ncbi:MAG: hypothetical protein GXP19_06750 [Gammaproteobacteria bacterium]|nr:hypothetical protein [Gammaproteobacteria bacterium]
MLSFECWIDAQGKMDVCKGREHGSMREVELRLEQQSSIVPGAVIEDRKICRF